jgi:protein TonB
MKTIALALAASGILLAGVCAAQARDPASPTTGNPQRGRDLLAILGPKPHNAAGISPLQQQELNRRIRCAATRQEIQDQLDFEAAGSSGFYSLPQLRATESEICMPPPEVMLPALPPPPRPSVSAPPSHRSPASPPPPPPHPVYSAPAAPVATVDPHAPSYTPAPDYPHDEMAAGHEGTVLVQLVMNADGSVKAASVARSSNFPVLDASALTAAKTWRIPAAAGRTIDVPLKFSAH